MHSQHLSVVTPCHIFLLTRCHVVKEPPLQLFCILGSYQHLGTFEGWYQHYHHHDLCCKRQWDHLHLSNLPFQVPPKKILHAPARNNKKEHEPRTIRLSHEKFIINWNINIISLILTYHEFAQSNKRSLLTKSVNHEILERG